MCKSIEGNAIARKLGSCSLIFDLMKLQTTIITSSSSLLITLFSLRMGIIRNLNNNNNNSFLHLGQHHVKFHYLIILFQVAIEGNYVNLPNVGLDNISVRSRLLLLPGDQNSSIFFLSFFFSLLEWGERGTNLIM